MNLSADSRSRYVSAAWAITGGLLVSGGIILLLVSKVGLATDDVYITYRYAHNFSSGLGLVFNPGQKSFGVSDPGVALVLGSLNRLTQVRIPVLGTIVTAVSLLAICGVLVREGLRTSTMPQAVASAMLVGVFPALWMGQGSGPIVALAALLVAASLVDAAPRAAGVVAGLGIWCRPDAVLGALLLLWALRGDRKVLQRFAASFFATVALGVIGAYLAFGTLVPSTLVAKRYFAANNPASFSRFEFWRRAIEVFSWSASGTAAALVSLGGVGIVRFLVDKSRPLRLVAGYAIASAVFYTLIGVPFFLWYTAPATVALLAAAPFGAWWLVRIVMPASLPKAYGAVLTTVLCLCLVTPPVARALRWTRESTFDWRLWGYKQAGDWIAANSPVSADIAFDEVGVLGFYSERPILDLVGLVSPEILPYAALGDTIGAFLSSPTEFVVFHTFEHRGGTRPIVSRPWFPSCYREVARFLETSTGNYVAVFQRRPGAELPPLRPPRKHRAPRT